MEGSPAQVSESQLGEASICHKGAAWPGGLEYKWAEGAHTHTHTHSSLKQMSELGRDKEGSHTGWMGLGWETRG